MLVYFTVLPLYIFYLLSIRYSSDLGLKYGIQICSIIVYSLVEDIVIVLEM